MRRKSTGDAVDVFLRSRASVGESPLYESRKDELIWVDMPRGALHRTAASGAATRSVQIDEYLGAVALRASGGLVGAARDRFVAIGEGGSSEIAMALHSPQMRLNDAKCDPRGRLWAGSTASDYERGRGVLHRLDPDGTVTAAVTGLTLPNGLGWSPDGKRFYLADSKEHTIFAGSFDLEDGVVGELSALVQGDFAGEPDGLCVDEQGCIWVAFWGGGRILRFDQSGRQIREITVPVTQPSSCAFGAGSSLYITSASYGTSETREPLAGSVFVADVGVGGVAIAAFAG